MKRKIIGVIALTLCVLMTVLCLTACGGSTSSDEAKSALVGTWASNEAEGSSYIFSEDGTGKWDMGEGLEMSFTYVDKSSSVEITYEGTSEAQVWDYSIDSSTLTMKDSDGTTLTYTKK